jgi:hypothetical protein
MPYEIRKYDGTVLGTVGDGIADTSNSSLTFIGKNVSNFGKAQNENILHLLEHFASNVEPTNRLRGQGWYDTGNYVFKIFNGGDWVAQAGLDFTDTKPLAGHPGYLWLDSVNKQLYVHDGDDYRLVGPQRVEGFGDTGISSVTLKDVPNRDHAVLEIVVDGEIVGIISTASFLVNSSNAIPGFASVSRGINLKYQSNDFPLIGRATNANASTTATNLDAGTTGSVPYQTSAGHTSFLNIGSNNSVLFSNGSSPEWKPLTNVSAAYSTTSTNLLGGTTGALSYQTGNGTTGFVALDQEGYVLTAGATRPKWLPLAGLSAGSALTATNASKLLNGASTSYIYASTGTSASTIAERDANGNIWAYNMFATNFYGETFHGTAVQAQYADLAEKYLADEEYEVGTVVAIGGEKEITACQGGDRAIGVVSGNPAYLMNKDLVEGTAVALKGRVPCKVFGSVRKGQRLVAYNNGTATVGINDVFAISLETNDNIGVKVVEVLVL